MDRIDTPSCDESLGYEELIRKNIEYDIHTGKDVPKQDRELFDECYRLICDVVMIKPKDDTVRINGKNYPYNVVKGQYLKLTSEHIDYVLESLRQTKKKISNIRAYLLTALYNAPFTISHYYKQEVQHDMEVMGDTLSRNAKHAEGVDESGGGGYKIDYDKIVEEKIKKSMAMTT